MKYVRHLGQMKHEFRLWREHYRIAAEEHPDWPLSGLEQRAEALDDMWHSLDDAQRSLMWLK